MGRIVKAAERRAQPRPIGAAAAEAVEIIARATIAAAGIRRAAKWEVVELACAMARQVISRAVEMEVGVLDDIYRRALAAAAELTGATVRVHPADRARSEIDVLAARAGFAVADDPDMATGGCRVVAGGAEVDATLEAAVEAWKAALLGGDHA